MDVVDESPSGILIILEACAVGHRGALEESHEGTSGGSSEIAVEADGAHTDGIDCAGGKTIQCIGITQNLYAVGCRGVEPVVTRLVGIGNGDGSRCGGDIAERNRARGNAFGQGIHDDIVEVGSAVAIVAEGDKTSLVAGEGHAEGIPHASGMRHASCYRHEALGIGRIHKDTGLITVAGRSITHSEGEHQLRRSALEGGQCNDRMRSGGSHRIEAVATGNISGAIIKVRIVVAAVAVEDSPARNIHAGSSRSRGTAGVGVEVLRPGQAVGREAFAEGAEGVGDGVGIAIAAVGHHADGVLGVGAEVGEGGDGVSDSRTVNNCSVGNRHYIVEDFVGIHDNHSGRRGGDILHSDTLRTSAAGGLIDRDIVDEPVPVAGCGVVTESHACAVRGTAGEIDNPHLVCSVELGIAVSIKGHEGRSIAEVSNVTHRETSGRGACALGACPEHQLQILKILLKNGHHHNILCRSSARVELEAVAIGTGLIVAAVVTGLVDKLHVGRGIILKVCPAGNHTANH